MLPLFSQFISVYIFIHGYLFLKYLCSCLWLVAEEAERITQSNGRVFYLHDEPGVYRVWMPNGKTPGLALSRAIGDHCVKEFGLISEPDVTQRNITSRDQFVILATDGVCVLLLGSFLQSKESL